MMVRTEIAKKHLFDEEVVFQDYEMWTRLAPLYRMGNLQQVLVKYRGIRSSIPRSMRTSTAEI